MQLGVGALRRACTDARRVWCPLGRCPATRVWLYTSVAADYDGATLLPHFIKHYLSMGVRPENFLVVVNHNPAKANPHQPDPVAAVTDVLDRCVPNLHLLRPRVCHSCHSLGPTELG